MSDRAAALAFLRDTPLLMQQSALEGYIAALRADGTLTRRRPAAAVARRLELPGSGVLGVLPFIGPIFHRPSMLSWWFGGTSLVEARHMLAELLDDSRVASIAIEFDTPGGGVESLPEFAAELREARQRKPIIGVVNTLAASAGYWLAAQCSEIVVLPSAHVGSVGVYLVHDDVSAMNERIGYKPTYIGVPRYKTEGNPDSPLADETREYLQSQVDAVYDKFVTDIVRGRGKGLTRDRVLKTFGEGRVVSAEEAVRRGMADRLITFPADAMSYAAGHRNRTQAAQERQLSSALDWALLESAATEGERNRIRDRILRRAETDAAVGTAEHLAEVQADVDYAAAAIARAEAALR